MLVRTIESDQTLLLRQKLLRPNQPLSSSQYPCDSHDDTLHLGAFINDQLVAVLTLFPEVIPESILSNEIPLNHSHRSPMTNTDLTLIEQSIGEWRFRGMACLPEFQSQGIGSQLIESGWQWVLEKGGECLWCNARTSAISFYLKNGFVKYGNEFDIEGIGPHIVLVRAKS